MAVWPMDIGVIMSCNDWEIWFVDEVPLEVAYDFYAMQEASMEKGSSMVWVGAEFSGDSVKKVTSPRRNCIYNLKKRKNTENIVVILDVADHVHDSDNSDTDWYEKLIDEELYEILQEHANDFGKFVESVKTDAPQAGDWRATLLTYAYCIKIGFAKRVFLRTSVTTMNQIKVFHKIGILFGEDWAPPNVYTIDDFRRHVLPIISQGRGNIASLSPSEWRAIRNIPTKKDRFDKLNLLKKQGALPDEFIHDAGFQNAINVIPWHMPGPSTEGVYSPPWKNDQDTCPILWEYALSDEGRRVLTKCCFSQEKFSFGAIRDPLRPPVRAMVNDDSDGTDLLTSLQKSEMSNSLGDLIFKHDYLWLNIPCLINALKQLVTNAANKCNTRIDISDHVFNHSDDSIGFVCGMLVKIWNSKDTTPNQKYVTFNPDFPGERVFSNSILPLISNTGAVWFCYSGKTSHHPRDNKYNYKVIVREDDKLNVIRDCKSWPLKSPPPTFAFFMVAEATNSRWRSRPEANNKKNKAINGAWHVNPIVDYRQNQIGYESFRAVFEGIQI